MNTMTEREQIIATRKGQNMTRWYKRDGRRVSEATVASAKATHAAAKRTGRLGPLRCTVQPDIAARIDEMTLHEWANYTGQFTYRPDTKGNER